ncbi:MAG: hypothetical protein M3220_06655 [Chloroflexota bacterium]|nr:hypothetical protein [Chloroflexota bacterium]
MVDPMINAFVLVMFGLLIGVSLQVTILIMPETGPARSTSRGQHGTEGDLQTRPPGFLHRMLGAANAAAEEGRQAASSMPRSGRLAMGTFYGLIAMLVIVLWYSPVRMNWWILLGSILAGSLISQWTFALAKAGKIHLRGSTPQVPRDR